jgi:hypothetical protein
MAHFPLYVRRLKKRTRFLLRFFILDTKRSGATPPREALIAVSLAQRSVVAGGSRRATGRNNLDDVERAKQWNGDSRGTINFFHVLSIVLVHVWFDGDVPKYILFLDFRAVGEQPKMQ